MQGQLVDVADEWGINRTAASRVVHGRLTRRVLRLTTAPIDGPAAYIVTCDDASGFVFNLDNLIHWYSCSWSKSE